MKCPAFSLQTAKEDLLHRLHKNPLNKSSPFQIDLEATQGLYSFPLVHPEQSRNNRTLPDRAPGILLHSDGDSTARSVLYVPGSFQSELFYRVWLCLLFFLL